MQLTLRMAAALALGLVLAFSLATADPAREAPDSIYFEPQPPQPPPPPPQLVLAQTFTEPGRVTSMQIDSVALGSRRKVYLYLPPGYDQGEQRYPVIYLMRGHEFEWLDNKSSESRKGRNAAIIADELIMSGAMPPVILVMPPMASGNKELIALGVNLPNPKVAKGAAGVGPGRFEDFILQEVVPSVDREFRTIADGRYRGIDGFSLGGFTALTLAMRHPDVFASAGAFEGSFVYPEGKRPDGRPDEYLQEEMKDTFGTPPDLELLRRVNPIDLADALDAAHLQRITFHVQSVPAGRGDQARAAMLVSRLTAKGAVNTFVPMEMAGSKHGWYWADDHVKQVLPKHVEVFAKTAALER
ncbi:MAG TPA: alpha/beta hydrolase-fold protein [Symbiobacteriaceae bacterium]|nr:alpha/beta hydrolase-fold protein [Symbiobacteriaceae bacterium]